MQSAANLYRRAYGAVNYRLRNLVSGRLSGLCRPVSICLLITENCNAHCVHCDMWKTRAREDSPSQQQWESTLTQLREWLGPVHVLITGGEALMRSYTVDLVAHGSRIGLWMELLTHGCWEDQTKIERLALARPGRVTISLDGIGELHDVVRGRARFFERTSKSIETLKRMRQEHGLGYEIRLKNVIMRHNLEDTLNVARFATQPGMHVLYQPIEQNYNTVEDDRWFEHSDNWPKDPEQAVAVVLQLIELKKQGAHIANTFTQLEAMIPYFRNPDSLRIATQSHAAHEARALCNALTTLQIQSNGDVKACIVRLPIGNIKTEPLREIWKVRGSLNGESCCLLNRASEAEKRTLGLVSLQ